MGILLICEYSDHSIRCVLSLFYVCVCGQEEDVGMSERMSLAELQEDTA